MKNRGINIRVTNNSYSGCDEACGYDQATKDALDAIRPPEVTPPGGWPAPPPMPAGWTGGADTSYRPTSAPPPGAGFQTTAQRDAQAEAQAAQGIAYNPDTGVYELSSNQQVADPNAGGFNPMQMMRSGFMMMRAPRMALHLLQSGIQSVTAMANAGSDPASLDQSMSSMGDAIAKNIPIIGGLIGAVTDMGNAFSGKTQQIQAAALVAKENMAVDQINAKTQQQLYQQQVQQAGFQATNDLTAAGVDLAGFTGPKPGQTWQQAYQQWEQTTGNQLAQKAADAKVAGTEAQLAALTGQQGLLQQQTMIDPNLFNAQVQGKIDSVKARADAAWMQSSLGGMGGDVGRFIALQQLQQGAAAAGLSQEDYLAQVMAAGVVNPFAPPGAAARPGAAAPTPTPEATGLFGIMQHALQAVIPQTVSMDAQAAGLKQQIVDNMGLTGDKGVLMTAADNLQQLQMAQTQNTQAQLANLQKQESMMPQYQQELLAQKAAARAPMQQELGLAQTELQNVTGMQQGMGFMDQGSRDAALQAAQMAQQYGIAALSQEDIALIKQTGGTQWLDKMAQQTGDQSSGVQANLQQIYGVGLDAQGNPLDMAASQQNVLDLKDKLNFQIQLDTTVVAQQIAELMAPLQKEIAAKVKELGKQERDKQHTANVIAQNQK